MTPDVNVLVDASRRYHVYHATALAWLDGTLEAGADSQPLAIFLMAAFGFLRLSTNPKVFAEPTPSRPHKLFGARCWTLLA